MSRFIIPQYICINEASFYFYYKYFTALQSALDQSLIQIPFSRTLNRTLTPFSPFSRNMWLLFYLDKRATFWTQNRNIERPPPFPINSPFERDLTYSPSLPSTPCVPMQMCLARAASIFNSRCLPSGAGLSTPPTSHRSGLPLMIPSSPSSLICISLCVCEFYYSSRCSNHCVLNGGKETGF